VAATDALPALVAEARAFVRQVATADPAAPALPVAAAFAAGPSRALPGGWEEALATALKGALAAASPVLTLFTKRIYKVFPTIVTTFSVLLSAMVTCLLLGFLATTIALPFPPRVPRDCDCPPQYKRCCCAPCWVCRWPRSCPPCPCTTPASKRYYFEVLQ